MVKQGQQEAEAVDLLEVQARGRKDRDVLWSFSPRHLPALKAANDVYIDLAGTIDDRLLTVTEDVNAAAKDYIDEAILTPHRKV